MILCTAMLWNGLARDRLLALLFPHLCLVLVIEEGRDTGPGRKTT